MAEIKQNYNPLEEMMNDGTMETTDTDVDEGFGPAPKLEASFPAREKKLPDIIMRDMEDASKNQLPMHEGQPPIDPLSSIDMECSVGEDDLDEDTDITVGAKKPNKPNIQDEKHVTDEDLKKNGGKLDFGSDDEYEQMKKYNDEIAFKNKKLMDENLKELEKGVPTKNMWKDLNKKYQKTQKKGAWGWHEARKPHGHWSGDPEQDMKDFNHDMGIGGKGTADGGIGAVATAAPAASAPAGGDAGGMGESKNNTVPGKYTAKCKALLEEMGFNMCKDDKGCHLIDLNKGKEGNSIETVVFTTPEELFNLLKDYIDDFVLCPLCEETGEYKAKYADWVEWYTPAKKEMFPEIAKDIDTCDMICNHCGEIKF